MSKTQMEEAIKTLKLSMKVEFVPFSKSRHKKEKHPSLNWIVAVVKDDRDILTTDYMAGCGHCPSYKQGRLSVDEDKAIRLECERGKPSMITSGGVHTSTGKPTIVPSLADVLYSLVSDADAIYHSSFEEWADELGYDTDSRSAEKTYRACLDVGLKLRAALGDEGLKLLQEAAQDY